MFRRLGEKTTLYRAESPSQNSLASHHNSEVSLPSVDYSQEDRHSCNTLIGDEWSQNGDVIIQPLQKPSNTPTTQYERIITRREIANTESDLCKKLSLIVDLVSDFANDANRLYEGADELLKELRTKIRVYIYFLDVEMADVEKLLRFNVDRSTICDERIDWLLHFTKCHKEMRRVLNELSEEVCEDLESCLEMRAKGVIGKKPSSIILSTLSGMRNGMMTASKLLGCLPRQRA
ncbi:uncharacterized protein CELE_T05C1.3 [Caenorhabditis elegans]|uniref:Uncharacterized protein n=1 Tax=Caenorhabditis elegans TaxID=6239 RepID=Q22219_CAEEL|nr:Uncharacterized protein CELE_T05C1.3 [Caenorhabditis elegans]CCD61744.1 Uncharacterized protein CELE_T05C1.3 [Caenorhabditis elegans]|eukprot:NP_494793.1 Uncharacterized protein CELE_T05C1.3 [Caenorhabditis elegans]